MSEKKMCCELIRDGWHKYPCSRGAAYEHEGRWFCKTHHPPTVKARDAERLLAWRKKWADESAKLQVAQDAKKEQERLAGLVPELMAVLQEVLDQPRLTEGADWWGRVGAVMDKVKGMVR